MDGVMDRLPATVKVPTWQLVELLVDLKATEGTSGTYRPLLRLVTEQTLRVRIIDAVAGLEAARGKADQASAGLTARIRLRTGSSGSVAAWGTA
jgi:hypothetical protein